MPITAQNEIILGCLRLDPQVLRTYLKKSHYWLKYEWHEHALELSANHGRGGETIFTATGVPYETAARLARELGLVAHRSEAAPLFWSRYSPVVELWDDGSPAAKELLRMLADLALPFNRSKSVSGHWECSVGQGRMVSTMFTVEQVKQELAALAERYREVLSTTP